MDYFKNFQQAFSNNNQELLEVSELKALIDELYYAKMPKYKA